MHLLLVTKCFFCLVIMVKCQESNIIMNVNSRNIQLDMKGSPALYNNEPLLITCTGTKKMEFFYPPNTLRYQPGELLPVNPLFREYSIEDISQKELNQTHIITFRRNQTEYGDTGWYGCGYSDQNSSDIRWIHVQRIEAAWDSLLVACQDDSFEVSPERLERKMIILENNKEVYDSGNINSSDFIFRAGQQEIEKNFTILFYSNRDIFEEYRIMKLQSIDNCIAQEPYIQRAPLRHVTNGQNFRVNCTMAIYYGMDYNVTWIYPKENNRITSQTHSIKDVSDSFNATIIKNELIIKNVNYNDAGTYVCILKTTTKNISTSMKLNVHDPQIENYIYLSKTIDDSKTKYSRREGDYIIWAVSIDTDLMPKITWFKQMAQEIQVLEKKERYEVSWTQSESTSLSIVNLTINDTGTYFVKVESQDLTITKILYFDLEVYETSKIFLSDLFGFYKMNDYVELHCFIDQYPRPNITWSFGPNDLHPTSKNVVEDVTLMSVNSTIKFQIVSGGNIKCIAENEFEKKSVTAALFLTGDFEIIVPKEDVTFIGDSVELVCVLLKKFILKNKIYWTVIENNYTLPLNQSDSRIKIHENDSELSYRLTLSINPVYRTDEKIYRCNGNMTNDILVKRDYHLNVFEPKKLVFNKTNLKNDTFFYPADDFEIIELYCYVDGLPKPKIIWQKDNVTINKPENCQYEISNNSQVLQIKSLFERCSGNYSCRAQNRHQDYCEAYRQIKIKEKKDLKFQIIAIISTLIIFISIFIYLFVKLRNEKKLRKQLAKATGLSEFKEDALEPLNLKLTINDQIDLLSYDKKWEISRDKLKIGKILGQGEFGVVRKAEARGMCDDNKSKIIAVAVKMVKKSTGITNIRALASELKIMIYIGKHLNVVNLLGACTKNMDTHGLLVIVEYCPFGNLHDYLIEQRPKFINQIDPLTGKINIISIGSENATKSKIKNNNNKINYSTSSFSRKSLSSDSSNDRKSIELSDGIALNNNLAQPNLKSNYYHGDYDKSSNLKTICTQDLFSWSLQVAKGMEYLSQKNVLHGDLAARNILLAENDIVKISDFGLAKNIYRDGIYQKKGNAPVPFKWMAIDSLKDGIFTTQSDVWSFGIVLWEFFSLAQTPYAGMNLDEYCSKVFYGYRMKKPEYATNEIYNIMFKCWLENPTLRPTFTDLVNDISDVLDNIIKKDNNDLKTPYVNMNRKLYNDTKHNNLMIQSSPDHPALSISNNSYVDEPRININKNLSYVSMN